MSQKTKRPPTYLFEFTNSADAQIFWGLAERQRGISKIQYPYSRDVLGQRIYTKVLVSASGDKFTDSLLLTELERLADVTHGYFIP